MEPFVDAVPSSGGGDLRFSITGFSGLEIYSFQFLLPIKQVDNTIFNRHPNYNIFPFENFGTLINRLL